MKKVTPDSTELRSLVGIDLLPSLIAKRDQGPECSLDLRFRKASLFERVSNHYARSGRQIPSSSENPKDGTSLFCERDLW